MSLLTLPGTAAGLRAALRVCGIVESELASAEKLGAPRPVIRRRAAGVVVETACDATGVLRIHREVHGRRWAVANDIPTARVYGVAEDYSWMVGEWLPHSDADVTGEYLVAALATARAIAAAPVPEPGPARQQWRAPRHQAIARHWRGLRAGLPLREWVLARKAAAALVTVSVAHGDFYHRNLPWAAGGVVAAVDWEYLGSAPRYCDVVRFWSVLPTKLQRDFAMEQIMAAAPAEHEPQIATLAWWLTLRRIGENVKAPPALRNPTDTAHAWSVLDEARALVRPHRG